MKRLYRCLFVLFAFGASTAAFPQVIPVEPLSKGLFGSRPTMTWLWEASEPEVTLVGVMGYPGHFGMKAGDTEIRNPTARMLQLLAFSQRVRAHVVIFDSPSQLQGIPARSSADHLERIRSVVEFYREKLGKPVLLFGHSDGSVSVSEYLNRSADNRKSVVGAILSAGRSETRITEDWALPTLVLHHDRDGCDLTPYSGARQYFSAIKARNSQPTELATVQGGVSSGPPCSTGFHMYERAHAEARMHLEEFMDKYRKR